MASASSGSTPRSRSKAAVFLVHGLPSSTKIRWAERANESALLVMDRPERVVSVRDDVVIAGESAEAARLLEALGGVGELAGELVRRAQVVGELGRVFDVRRARGEGRLAAAERLEA